MYIFIVRENGFDAVDQPETGKNALLVTGSCKAERLINVRLNAGCLRARDCEVYV